MQSIMGFFAIVYKSSVSSLSVLLGSALGGRVDDHGEVGRLQGSAADQAAVHVLLAYQLVAVLGVHAAAVLDGGGLGHGLAVQLADHLADLGADLLGLVCGRGLAGADGPDGLVGDDHVGHLLGGGVPQGDLGLHPDQLLGDALYPLRQAVVDAADGLQAGVQGGQGPLVHGLVGLGEVLAALGVAHDDVLHAQVHQHVGADLAGVGAGLFKVDVLGAHVDVGALGLGHGGDQVGVGGADDHLAAGVLDGGDQLVDQGSGLGGVLVHLPVAGDDRLALCFIHRMFSLSFALPQTKECGGAWPPHPSQACEMWSIYAFWMTAMPGSSLPSRYSREAPPPVEMWVILSPRPICWTAAALSPPPMTVVASLSAIALATARVPAARVGFSNTPMGPFQTTVLEALTASANSFMVSGPMSQPSMSAGIWLMG